MTYEDLIGHYGRPSDAARALEVDRRLVDSWKKGRIPTAHQLKAQHLTAGALQADEQAQAEGREIASYVVPTPEPARAA